MTAVPWSVDALGDTCPNDPDYDQNFLLTDIFAGP
jgi:hypothetical protein